MTLRSTVMVNDKVIGEMYKDRLGNLVRKLEMVEFCIANRGDCRIFEYRELIDKPVGRFNPMDHACSVDGDHFFIKQTGWFKGIPVVTVTSYYEEDSD